MTARIYKPAKNAMQSGMGRSDSWVVQHEPTAERRIDPLMGWTGSTDTQAQVTLNFETKEEAIAYVDRLGLPYVLTEPTPRKHIRKSYSDNFKFGRIGSWTH